MTLNKTQKISIAFILLLIGFRAVLPIVIESKVNDIITDNEKIEGHIGDVDLWILSGRVSVEDIEISKADARIPAPLFAASELTFSISWSDLIHGRLFGDIEIDQPILNVVDGNQEKNTQTGAEINWREALAGFYPFEINRIAVNGGEVHFRNFESDPPVDIYLQSIDAEALNITNEIKLGDSQAAQVKINATTIGQGKVAVRSNFNLMSNPSRGSLDVSVSDLNLNAINDFARAYANLDVQGGKFDLKGSLSALEGDNENGLDGTITPTVTNLNVLRWRQDADVQNDPGIILAWEGLLDAVTWLLEVGPKDKMTTDIPIRGSINEPDIGVVSAVFGLIGNAIGGSFTAGEPANDTDDGDSNKTSDQGTKLSENDTAPE